VVVPEGAVATKLANIVRNGATLWRCAPNQAAREVECARVQRETGATLVHPYADAKVIAGQGTAALELVRQAGATLDVLVVPVGGGGLAAGTLLALQQLLPDCALVLAEPAGAADTARSLAAGERLLDFVPDTVCDGLRGALGAPNFELLNQRAEVITVDDVDTVTAMRRVWQVMKQVVEPSSAITLAAVLAQPERFAGRNVGLIFSGGNVDLDALPWGKE
jgi:threonine dehydratase